LTDNSDVKNVKETVPETVGSEADSGRRKLFRRLLALAGLGVTGALLSQDKLGLLPSVYAAPVTTILPSTLGGVPWFDNTNGDLASSSGFAFSSGALTLTSAVANGKTMSVINGDTGASGYSCGIHGDSGVGGFYAGAGVVGTVDGRNPSSTLLTTPAGVQGLGASSYGVYGESTNGNGVYGESTNSNGVYGAGKNGLFGVSSSTSGSGVMGTGFGNATGVLGVSAAATSISVVARCGSGQTANLQEWQISTNSPPYHTTFSAVDAAGKLGVGTGSPQAELDVNASTGFDPLHARGAPSGSAPNAFVVQNMNSGNAKSQFTFRDSGGANRYSFGNDQAGIGQQNFFIYDEVSKVFPLTIDSSGTVHTLDIAFANGIRATEDGTGLAFKSPDGTKLASIDIQGNLHIKGDVIKDL